MSKPQSSAALHDRLATLPTKEGRILRGLLDIGHIDEHIVNTVIDAGEIAGDCSRLSAFTIAYLSLRSRNVPVGDVVQMAKQLRRPVNLWWSERRWRDEHEKLSRTVTLKRLADDNTTYGLDCFRAALPERFPGYLIQTARRLGMEGLRQRHCVASYHHRIATGNTAICVVFINKTRWTVELWKTDNSDIPLRIVQVKTKLNADPPPDVRKTIHAALNIPLSATGYRPSTPGAWKQNLARILRLLQQYGVELVTVTFDGCGDSGCVDDPEITGGSLPDALAVRQEVKNTHFANGAWVYEQRTADVEVKKALVRVCEDYLDDTNVNWYDNDGGFGTLTIDVNLGAISMDVNTRYTDHDCAYSDEETIESYLALLED